MCLTLADPESSTQNLNYGWKWIWGFQLDAANTSADLTTLKPGAPDYVDGENCISMGNGLVCEDRVFSFHPWLQPVVMNGKLACLLQLSFRIYSMCVCVFCVYTFAKMHVWRSLDNLRESVLSYQVGPRDESHVAKLGGKHLYPLCHFGGTLETSLPVS